MKKILFILLLCIVGCKEWSYNPDKYQLYEMEGFISYVFNGHAKFEPIPDPLNKIKKCGKCDKNCKIKSGDGLVSIPCECGENCECHKKETGKVYIADDCDKIPNRQIWYFGHDATCHYCKMTKLYVFPKLTQSKPDNKDWVAWKIGDSEKDFIRVFEWTPELGEEYEVQTLPTYILFVDKKEVARHVGYLDHVKLSHFYYTGDINKKAKLND